MITTRLLAAFLTASASACIAAPTVSPTEGYSPPIHVLAAGSLGRCINSQKDEVTVSLRRVLVQKTAGFFTSDKKAGVAVIATLNADSAPPSKTPSVTLLDINQESAGQVSLALEYPIASQLHLQQGTVLTQNLQLSIFLAKTRGSTGFGKILSLAGQAIQKLPIPKNPYSTAANQFLDFSNTLIQSEISDNSGALQFASMTLQFADHDEDAATCLLEGNQMTGALAVIRSTGAKNANLLPVTNLDSSFCFRYSTASTYELQFVAKTNGSCTQDPSQKWSEVPNDYVMMLVSAAKLEDQNKAGGGTFKIGDDASASRFIDLGNSKKLCDSMAITPILCGVQ